MLDGLERPDRAPELLALLCVRERDVEDRLGGADGLDRQRRRRHLDRPPDRHRRRRPRLAEGAIAVDPGAVEHDTRQGAARVECLDGLHAEVGAGDDEGTHALVRVRVGRPGDHRDLVRHRSVDDRLLRAVEHEAGSVGCRGGGHAPDVDASAVLGECERAGELAGRDTAEEALLLLR